MPVKRDIRLLVSDIDNTILRSDGTIAPETTATFERAARAGMRTVLASSRTVDSARFLLDKVGELTHMIMLTGCVLTDVKTGECLLHRSIDPDTARELLAYADTAGPCYFEACGGGRYVLARKSLDYVRSRGIFSRYLEDLSACLAVVDSLGEYFAASGTPVDKMFLYSAEPGRQELLASALPGRGRLRLVSPVPNGLDILPRDVSKGAALRVLLRRLGLREEQVMVFGDSENDAEMFLPGALKVAVGNAYPSLKARADFVSRTNDEHGVACAIDALALS